MRELNSLMFTFTVSEQREMNGTLSKQLTKLNTHGDPPLFEKEAIVHYHWSRNFPGYGESSGLSVNDFDYSFERLGNVTEKLLAKESDTLSRYGEV
jgi:hypothetical protein